MELLGTGLADVSVKDVNISIKVCSTAIQNAPIARILNDVLNSDVGVTLRGSGMSQNASANIATQVLQVLFFCFFPIANCNSHSLYWLASAL